MDSVIVIAIELCCQTPSPESNDLVTLPAPLGFVSRCHHKRGRLESQRQPLTTKVPATMCLGSGITGPWATLLCLSAPASDTLARLFQPAQSPPAPWLCRWPLLLLSVLFVGEYVFSRPFLSWLMFVSLAASEGCGGGSVQCPLGQTEHVRWLLALEGILQVGSGSGLRPSGTIKNKIISAPCKLRASVL